MSLSPLTRSPSPPPKRVRHGSLHHPNTPSHSAISAALAPSALRPHPLALLAKRDLPHAVGLPNHLAGTQATPAMREQVVTWCADMADDISVAPAVTAIAINLFDRFLSKRALATRFLHALTAACFLIAMKSVSDDPPCLELVARRARVSVDDMLSMESVVLNVLNWRVSVVTPNEVVADISKSVGVGTGDDRVEDRLFGALVMHALMDYRIAWMRATSIGVACVILGEGARHGNVHSSNWDYRTSGVYQLAKYCDVDLAEVDQCAEYLFDAVFTLFDDVEDVESDASQ